MKTVVINRAKWAIPRQTQKREEDSVLLSASGLRCCLGFLGKQCGIDDERMSGVYLPSPDERRFPRVLFRHSPRLDEGARMWSRIDQDEWRHTLAAINDADNVTDEERESWVREGFKRILKRRVRFVGKYAVKEPKR